MSLSSLIMSVLIKDLNATRDVFSVYRSSPGLCWCSALDGCKA